MIKKQLDFLKNLSVKLKQSNSSNEKKIVLNHFFNENNLLFDKIFDYILSYDKKYWVTSENISKLWEKFPHKYNFNEHDDLFLVLDKITCREITGYDAINYIIDLINFCGDEYKEYIFNIIDKDLKANVNVSLVNKISSNSVKEFKVALAERSDEAPMVHKINFDNEF
ncbi:hypothetical protein FACS189459_4180 [Bacilli bacterium]|nr:hypothetical protein FACS189459_4180 [Bacilli bacterium]